MRMIDILGAMVDVVAAADNADNADIAKSNADSEPDNHRQAPVKVNPMPATPDMDNDCDRFDDGKDDHNMGSEDDECNTYVPPLQTKIELMKKSEGMPNAFDDVETTDDNEIDDIKTLAGVMKQAMTDEDILDI